MEILPVIQQSVLQQGRPSYRCLFLWVGFLQEGGAGTFPIVSCQREKKRREKISCLISPIRNLRLFKRLCTVILELLTAGPSFFTRLSSAKTPVHTPWQTRGRPPTTSLFRLQERLERKAGEEEIKIQTKSSAVDLVTKTDERVEKIIIGSLKEQFGDGTHCFIGEESVSKGEACILTDKPTWIIDPVDGTTNFVHGFPFVAVSIAFAVNKQLEFGVVYSCLEDKMYKARRGQGAFCDDEQIQVSDVKDINKSIIISEHGTDRSIEKVTKIFSTMQKILRIPVHGLRGSGTAATNMCLVASGAVEAFFEIGIHCWDIAAGAVIVQEAGGLILDVDGGPFDLMSRRMMSANNDVIARRIIKEIEIFPVVRDDAPVQKK